MVPLNSKYLSTYAVKCRGSFLYCSLSFNLYVRQFRTLSSKLNRTRNIILHQMKTFFAHSHESQCIFFLNLSIYFRKNNTVNYTSALPKDKN